jgi:hypothetical protein
VIGQKEWGSWLRSSCFPYLLPALSLTFPCQLLEVFLKVSLQTVEKSSIPLPSMHFVLRQIESRAWFWFSYGESESFFSRYVVALAKLMGWLSDLAIAALFQSRTIVQEQWKRRVKLGFQFKLLTAQVFPPDLRWTSAALPWFLSKQACPSRSTCLSAPEERRIMSRLKNNEGLMGKVDRLWIGSARLSRSMSLK